MVTNEKPRSLEVRSQSAEGIKSKGARGSSVVKTYRSPAFAAIHEGIADLHQAGLVDAKTMREFDAACLTPILPLTPSAIRGIREKASISQAVLALHLNVTTGVVSKWERGEKQPSGPAAKLLSLAAKKGIAAIA